MIKSAKKSLPSDKAKWIWDGSDRTGHHYYLQARRSFTVGNVDTASLVITADAFYQVWINGKCLGHGPAKSADGYRSVDSYDLLPHLIPGENLLEFLVLSVGLGTMTYCPGDAGLLFDIRLDDKIIGSDAKVQVRRSADRVRPTARRWVMPCIEDVNALAKSGAWKPAKVVPKDVSLYPRRVDLPIREAVYPRRFVATEQVTLPNFSVTYRIKPALVSAEEAIRWNLYGTAATLRIPIKSPRAQTLTLTPTLGHVDWSYEGKKLYEGSGWALHPERGAIKIRLKKGLNYLTARHGRLKNHFEDIHLAGFVDVPVEVGTMEVARGDEKTKRVKPLLFANAQDLAVGAEIDPKGSVRRTIVDLGSMQNGWISFDVKGDKGSVVLLSFFEAMENTPSGQIQWPQGCNNALTYRLREGWQHFESFFPYGVRYIAIHEIDGAVEVRDLKVLKAACFSKSPGTFLTDDPLFNGIYRIAAQTLESGMDDTFTDCPTFEQVNWNFDNRIASEADMVVNANTAITRNSIVLFAEDKFHKGLVASQTPSTWDLRIPLWSFNWIFWCWDYYWYTGDLEFVRTVYPRVVLGVREALSRIGSLGLMELPGEWHFVEWAHGRDDDHAINGGEQAGLLQVLTIVGKLADALGKPNEFAPARAKLAKAINRHLWNKEKNCYVDSVHEDGKPSTVTTQVTNAMFSLYGAAEEKWVAKFARDLMLGKNSLIPYGSPYGLYYLLEVMDRYNYGDAILKAVGERWGDMLAFGDGTTWEMFREFSQGIWPTRSRCHPFSAYVVKYLVKYILGVEILAPGFASVRIDPRPPASMKTASGTIPTPHGPLRISWERKGRKLDLQVDAPKGIKVIKGRAS